MSLLIQVRVWMPLAMLVMGISSRGMAGQTPCHNRRETSPCSSLTPLRKRLMRSARVVMFIGSSGAGGTGRPRLRNSSLFRPIWAQ
jgi:hypothetical protein